MRTMLLEDASDVGTNTYKWEVPMCPKGIA